jgi:hypothetical protein
MPRADRVLFPAAGFTVADYRGAAKWLLPHLRNVPVSFKRFPDTVHGESFWEKDLPGFAPSWVKTAAVPRTSGESDLRYVLVNDLSTGPWGQAFDVRCEDPQRLASIYDSMTCEPHGLGRESYCFERLCAVGRTRQDARIRTAPRATGLRSHP